MLDKMLSTSLKTDMAETTIAINSIKCFREGEGDIPQFERRAYNTELVDLSITKEGIERILKTLDTSKSPGPDGLHPHPLAEMAEQLAEPFQALFSTSLEEGILPQGWKDGSVTPIFKKGKKHQPGNYRSVSLTSIPCRVMEKLVRNEIMEHLINNNLLSKFQHGFIKARSCTTQLLAVLDDWTDVIEHGENVDALYLADDTKVYRNIKTHIDREVLQSDLSRLEDWSRNWQLRFNADKCKVLHIGRDNEHYEYYMDRDTKIGVTTNERDLGVQIDPDLKFNKHVETVTKQSKQDGRHDTTSVHVQGRRHHQEAIH